MLVCIDENMSLVGLTAQHALLAVSVGGTVRRPYLLLYLKPCLLGEREFAVP